MKKHTSTQDRSGNPDIRRPNYALRRAAVLGAAVVLGVLGANEIKDAHNNHQRAVAAEAAERAVNNKEAQAIDATMYFKAGVTFRGTPEIIDDKNDGNTNKIGEIKAGEVLRVENPVTVMGEDGSYYFAITLGDKDDKRIVYINRDVEEQVDSTGVGYTITRPAVQQNGDMVVNVMPQLIDGSVELDSSNQFFIDGKQVSVGEMMTAEQVLDDLS
jgi:hypothetical protein